MTDAPIDTADTTRDEAGADRPQAGAAHPASRDEDRAPAPIWSRPAMRALFWAASLIALAGAGVAIALSAQAGWHGFILLCGLASVAFLLLYALAAGETAGRALSGPGKAQSSAPSSAVEALPDPVLVTDARGRAVYANAAYRALAREAAGLGAGFGAPGPDRIWPAGGAAAVYRLTRACEAGETDRREVLPPVKLDDGRMAVFSAEARPTPEGGAVWRFVEERGGAETEEPGAPEWAGEAPVGLFLADGEGRVLAANATLRRWLGRGPDQALKIREMFAGDTARAFAKSRGTGGVVRIDARLTAPDGAESPVVVALEWDEARPPRARGVVYALSSTGAPPDAAKRLAESGVSAGDTLDEMFAAAPFGVARLDGADPETAIVEDANSALVQLTAGAAVPGARFADLFRADSETARTEVFDKAMAGRGDPVEASVAAGEEARDVHLFLSASREGKRTAYLIDIGAQKDLERQFAQGAKMQAVGQLAGGVAHDFNNMLTVIRLGTDDLLTRHPVGDPSYQSLQQINSTVHRAAGLVKKLLAFSRKQTFKVETLELPDFLSGLSMLLRPMLEESVKLEIRHGRDVPMVRADATQLENAIMNLATNARDAMKANGGGTVEIASEAVDAEDVRRAGAPDPKEGRWAAIRVTDEGCGMDAQTLSKIFEPFFTTKAPGEGTGLGLSTVYGIVKQSGGFLFAESEPGRGTTFTIYLPEHVPDAAERERAETVKAEAEREPEPSDLAGRGRILLVEDEAGVRQLAAQSLVKRGYEVVEAGDGEEALEILEDEPGAFDLIVSDVVMPGLDGPGLLEKARDHLGEARVIFISGYAEEEFSHTLSTEAEVSFLSKPFTVQKLAERVKRELTR